MTLSHRHGENINVSSSHGGGAALPALWLQPRSVETHIMAFLHQGYHYVLQRRTQ